MSVEVITSILLICTTVDFEVKHIYLNTTQHCINSVSRCPSFKINFLCPELLDLSIKLRCSSLCYDNRVQTSDLLNFRNNDSFWNKTEDVSLNNVIILKSYQINETDLVKMEKRLSKSGEKNTLELDGKTIVGLNRKEKLRMNKTETLRLDENETLSLNGSETLRLHGKETLQLHEHDTFRPNRNETFIQNKNEALRLDGLTYNETFGLSNKKHNSYNVETVSNRTLDHLCQKQCINSICTGLNVCTCIQDHEPDPTDSMACRPICLEKCINGECVSPYKCLCNPGYSEHKLNKYLCVPSCKFGCKNGRCTRPEICTCFFGYELDETNKYR